jgi:hemerythrin-like domain-containing protein
MKTIWTRREIITSSLLLAAPVLGADSESSPAVSSEGGISAAEDLMREHGVLDRILLIYEECLRRIESKDTFDAEVLHSASTLVQSFVENYHEKLEEDHIFGQFEKAGKLTDLTGVLRKQHVAGRALTLIIIDLADDESLEEPKSRTLLKHSIRQFIRLYRPHKAREDTVLFPAIHSIMTERQLAALGDTFEDKEQDLFGKDGFEKVVEDVAALERTLSLYELSQFTPSS